MNDDQWPPPAPGVNKAFKKAHANAKETELPKDSSKIVSKKQIEELERQRKKAASHLTFTPSGMKATHTADREREKRIEKMKQRLQQSKGKARDDFNKSNER